VELARLHTRLVVLHELGTAITKVREKHGLPSFDDGLSDEPTTPFQIIRALLLTPPDEGAYRGAARFEEPIARHQE